MKALLYYPTNVHDSKVFLMLILFASMITCNLTEANKILDHPFFNRVSRREKIAKDRIIATNYTMCKLAIENLIQNNVRDPFFRPFIEYSGKKLNDFGNYDECEKSRNSTFFIISIDAFNSPTPFFNIGSCMPNICTNETFYLALKSFFPSKIPFFPKLG